MLCPTCGYTLFNLPEARCPECGSPFDVTKYSFEPGSVQFACPRCGERYDGDGERGLPKESAFDCGECAHSLREQAGVEQRPT